jgi:uncharacterized protein (TIGR03086 family)
VIAVHAEAGVELLERAIGFTRGALAGVTDERLAAPTPCSRWLLGDLLDHMADSLDAFTEASTGLVPVTAVPTNGARAAGARVELLRTRACTLLGAWSGPAAATIWLDDRALTADVVLGAGALEITLHGWDVGQATGVGVPIPEALAADLLPLARSLIGTGDRGLRFAREVTPRGHSPVEALLGFSGRSPLQQHL